MSTPSATPTPVAPESFQPWNGESQAPVDDASSTRDVATDEATKVKDTAVDAGQQVAGTAKDEASHVLSEARTQATSMWQNVSSEVKDQAGTQQQRIATAVHSLSTELGGMASSSSESGPLTDLAHEASRRGGEIAHWLEKREPSDVLDEVKRFARRRPVTFLLLCGAAGVLAGRITRGAVAAHTELDSPSGHHPQPTPPGPALETGSFEPAPYAPVSHEPAPAATPTVVAPTIYSSTPESTDYSPAGTDPLTDRSGLSR